MLTKHNLRMKNLSLALILLLSIQCLDAKRIYSSGSSRKTSSSSNTRRTSGSSKPSYSSSSDLTRLSYSPNQASAPKPSNSYSSGSNNHGSQPAPIGWNVPQKQGPPPAYSATNPVGGAKTNIHESAPAYKPAQNYNSNPPSYSQATNTHNSGGTAYRPRMNSTGGFGSNYHTPIAATNHQGVQSTNYNRQQVPAGASYYPAGSSGIPAGATYYPSGALPAGASYHPQGGLPAGASYHPQGGIPAGASYYPSVALPAGASYHPQGGLPAGASYYPAAPAAYPAGATFLPAGAALPAGATYMSSPPRSSSGLGFGSGLLAGGLAGGILGHVLTPSGSRVEHVAAAPVNSGGGGGDDGKIIIINNGPPGSVTTTDVGHGTTVINAGGSPQAPAPVANSAPAPVPDVSTNLAPANLAPMNTPAAETNSGAGPVTGLAAGTGVAASTNVNPTPAPATGEQVTPAPGSIICVPVKVPQPDPTDSSKTIEVEQIACYPAPAPEALQKPTESGLAVSSTDGLTVLPDGVPLAPLNTPGTPAALSEQSGLKVASSAVMPFNSIFLSTLLTTLVAYCLH